MAVNTQGDAPRATRGPTARVETTRELAKFAGGVALFGIFWDAAIGHALTWENDPYWTYWITKTFLIATVFGLGTAWFGTGVGRGAAITAVHTLVLTIYYWTLSPIGLPANPSWLDLEHTWITGLPIHFAVIYLGYLTTLWLWRRRGALERGAPERDALIALLAAVAIVAVGGAAASLAIDEWPGFTYFLVRLLIAVPFLILWWSLAGRDWQANVGGAVVLGFIWATYGEFLGPIGLPDEPLRVLDEAPPPAETHWLDYREQWLISLPIYVVASALVLWVAASVLPRAGAGRRREPISGLPAAGATLALVVVPLVAGAVWVDPGGEEARIRASGSASLERGAWFSDRMVATRADLSLSAEDRVRKITPLPPHDLLRIEAGVAHPDGGTYQVSVDEPLVQHPAGRHTTAAGVGLDVWHHGKTGIGSEALPETLSELVAFGLAEVSTGGREIARGVPVQLMTGRGHDEDLLELHVGDPETLVPHLPDGHLRVVWSDFDGGAESEAHSARYVVGSTVLAVLLLLAFTANRALRARPHA